MLAKLGVIQYRRPVLLNRSLNDKWQIEVSRSGRHSATLCPCQSYTSLKHFAVSRLWCAAADGDAAFLRVLRQTDKHKLMGVNMDTRANVERLSFDYFGIFEMTKFRYKTDITLWVWLRGRYAITHGRDECRSVEEWGGVNYNWVVNCDELKPKWLIRAKNRIPGATRPR
jgi:hypothetical protein